MFPATNAAALMCLWTALPWLYRLTALACWCTLSYRCACPAVTRRRSGASSLSPWLRTARPPRTSLTSTQPRTGPAGSCSATALLHSSAGQGMGLPGTG